MAAGINLSLVSDVREFLKGTSNVEDALDDVAGSLDELSREGANSTERLGESFDNVARDADDAADKMERSLEGAAREAETAAEKLERGFRESFDTVHKRGDDAFDRVSKSAKDAANDGVSATDEFKAEAQQNFAETASSFDGSMESIADMAQSTLGGLATAIPGAGIFAAAGGAAAGAWLAQWNQAREDAKEVHNEMLDDLIDSEADYLSESYLQDQMWTILKGESKIIAQRDFEAVVRETGMTQEEVALAYAGQADLMTRVTNRLIDRRKVFEQQLEDETSTNDSAAQSAIKYLDGMIAGAERRTEAIQDGIEQVQRSEQVQRRWGIKAVESYEDARTAYQGYKTGVTDGPPLQVPVKPDWREFDREVRNKRVDVVGRVRVRGGQAVV